MNPVYDEGGLANGRQVGEAFACELLLIPKRHRLSWRNLRSGDGFSVLAALQQPIDEGFSRCLARCSWSEKDLLQDGVTFKAPIMQKLRQAKFLQVHDVLASSRSCSDKDHSSE